MQLSPVITTLRITVSALAILATAPSGQAAIQKFDLTIRTLVQNPDVSPNPSNGGVVAISNNVERARIDDSGPNPVLTKLIRGTNQTNTTFVPANAINIFVSSNQVEGPGADVISRGGTPPSFTGTGSTAAGSTIAWGIVTGWSVTGRVFCHSTPGVICTLAQFASDTTADPRNNSAFYDLGTWSFHSTGLISGPPVAFINSYASNGVFGNTSWVFRGFRVNDATVPALPVMVVALLGGSVAVGGIVSIRRRREPPKR